ncbi:unnamed protein product [Alopecurus aequalis]
MAGRRRGEGRMDAAVEHFAAMGYDKAEVRKVINGLFKNVYGEKCWLLLEEGCYSVVHEVLLEKEQEEKLQLQQQEAQHAQEQEHQEEECEADDEVPHAQEQEQQEEEYEADDEKTHAQEEEQQEECDKDDEELHAQEEEQQQEDCEDDDEELHAQEEEQQEEDCEDDDEDLEKEQQEEDCEDDDEEPQQETAMIGAPSENDMPIANVHDEAPSEIVLEVEQTEEMVQAVSAVELTEEADPMIMDPPAPEAASPHPAATGIGRTRRPCYGWISESESDSDYEEYLATRQQQVHVPSAGGI